jgi:hypothetical protein
MIMNSPNPIINEEFKYFITIEPGRRIPADTLTNNVPKNENIAMPNTPIINAW